MAARPAPGRSAHGNGTRPADALPRGLRGGWSRGRPEEAKGPGSAQWIRMDDAGTAALLEDMAGARTMPDFTVAYFADNDYRSHEVGPVAALPVIDRVDEALGR